MRKLLPILLFLLCAVSASAGTLSGTLKYPNATTATGTLYLSLSQQGSLSSSGGCGGPTVLLPTFQVQITVTSGTIQGSPTVIFNDCIAPANTYYNASFRDQTGNVLFSTQWSITSAACGSSSTCDVGTLSPVSIPTGQASWGTIYANSLIVGSSCSIGGSNCLTSSLGDGVYLRLDASNSPLTGILNTLGIQPSSASVGGNFTNLGGINNPYTCAFLGTGANSNTRICSLATSNRQLTLPDAGIAGQATAELTLASGTVALNTGALGGAGCESTISVSVLGMPSTARIFWSFSSDPSAVAGYGSAPVGAIQIYAWASASNVNFKQCSAVAVTPGAISLLWNALN